MKKLFTFFAMMVMLVTSSFADTTTDYLCFTNVKIGTKSTTTTISFNVVGTLSSTPLLQYSATPDVATSWQAYTYGTQLTLASGNSVYFRAKTSNSTFSKDEDNYINFQSVGNIYASGNIMSLVDASLSKVAIGKYAFYKLFDGCIGLKTAPKLPAIDVGASAYGYMFNGCTGLTKSPELPATKLAGMCYVGMFYGCTSLKTAPELKATTLADWCYASMFQNCTSLTTAPALPATTLASHCYWNMFCSCSSLDNVTVSFTDWNTSDQSTYGWLNGVSSTGTFNCPLSLQKTFGVNNIPSDWKVPSMPLCFEALNASTTLAFNIVGSLSSEPILMYSVDDGVNWSYYKFGNVITLANKGDKVYFRAEDKNATFSKDGKNYINFTSNYALWTSGNIMSLLDASLEQTTVPDYAFVYLFANSLTTTSPLLPATELGAYCYESMFEGSGLNSAPELPATTLGSYCYEAMFKDCYIIKETPELPATTLATGCYRYMFKGCRAILATPVLNAMSIPAEAYYGMFEDCTGLSKANEIAATEVETECCSRMFKGCTSLTTVQEELHPMDLYEACYYEMFMNCTSLTRAPELPAMLPHNACYKSMFEGCSNLTYAPELPMRTFYTCYRVYENMFRDCKKIDRVILNLRAGRQNLSHASEYGMYSGYTIHYKRTDCFPYTAMTRNAKSGGVFYFLPECMYYFKSGEAFTRKFRAEVSREETYQYSKTDDIAWKDDTRPWVDFTVENPRFSQDYWSVQLVVNGTLSNTPSLEYSLDGFTWNDYTIGDEIKRNRPGYHIFFRAKDKNATFSESPENYLQFITSENVNVSGNIMYLLDASGEQTSVPNYAFYRLFLDCPTCTAPYLPATTVGEYGYAYMFQNCRNIGTDPFIGNKYYEGLELQTYYHKESGDLRVLPATTLSYGCYAGMFSGCTNLTDRITLPATKLNHSCYYRMFENCQSLKKSPELPATDLPTNCYGEMFKGCTALNYVKVGFTDFNSSMYSTTNWLENVSDYGLFDAPDNISIPERSASTVPLGWVTNDTNFLCFTAGESTKIAFNVEGDLGTSVPILVYSTDNGVTWSSYTMGQGLIMNAGERIFFKAEDYNATFSQNVSNYIYFTSTGKVAASGNILSLLNEANSVSEMPQNAFINLFLNCTTLTSAPALPQKTLSGFCYNQMFCGCTALTEAPELPATTLDGYCYWNMFHGCTGLTSAPSLPATTLEAGCYQEMFSGCTGITVAPSLPATQLQPYCYDNMFYGCSNLSSISVSFTNWDESDYCTSNWVDGVAATGTFTCTDELDATKIDSSHIPVGWTIIGGSKKYTITELVKYIDSLKKGTATDLNGDESIDTKDVEYLQNKILQK